MKLDEFLFEAKSDGLIGKVVDSVKITSIHQTNKWLGDFNAYRKGLLSLEGCPREIEGVFRCNDNKLTSLEHGPSIVHKDFVCAYNQLTSLEHAPENLGNGGLYASNNNLTSLEHCPQKINGPVIVSDNNLTTLKGCPDTIYGMFDCSRNKLTSFEHGPTRVLGEFVCNDNKLASFECIAKLINGDLTFGTQKKITTLKDIQKHIHTLSGTIFLKATPIKSHVLGLLLIDGLKAVSQSERPEWVKIINQFLPNNDGKNGVMSAQTALIEAGLDEYAQL